MADVMAKILAQDLPESKKGPVLAKRKTKAEQELAEEQRAKRSRMAAAAQKKKLGETGMAKPEQASHTDIDYERQMKRIATRGVVALFNAINTHQREAAEDTSVTAREVKQMSKENFLSMLKASSGGGDSERGGKVGKAAGRGARHEDEDEGGADEGFEDEEEDGDDAAATTWSVLRDDYMMDRGKSVRDWERYEDEDGSENGEGHDEDLTGFQDPEDMRTKASAKDRLKKKKAKQGKGKEGKKGKR